MLAISRYLPVGTCRPSIGSGVSDSLHARRTQVQAQCSKLFFSGPRARRPLSQ